MFGVRLLRKIGGLRRLLVFIGVCALVLLGVQNLFASTTTTVTQSHSQSSNSIAHNHQSEASIHSAPAHNSQASASGGCSTKQCAAGEMSYSLVASADPNTRSSICINALEVLSNAAQISNGVYLVIIDGMTQTVNHVQQIQLQNGDQPLIDHLKKVSDSSMLVLVTAGHTAKTLGDDSRKQLANFGSESVKTLSADQSWALIGYKGGHAHPHSPLESVSDADHQIARLEGCTKMPVVSSERGEERDVVPQNGVSVAETVPDGGGAKHQARRDKVIYGDVLTHCGLKQPCRADQMSFSLYSGKNKDDIPQMCIDGRFVIGRKLNGAGRGLNVAVVNVTGKEVLRVAHFDTYAEDSSTLEIFLEQLAQGEVIAVLTFDEAATKLSSLAKQIFYELGSGLVQNIKFRASWYFVGQKGISGFTPFEELNYAKNNEWAKPIDKRICVPRLLGGMKVRADDSLKEPNQPRRAFCKKYDGYEDFCDDVNVDNTLTALPLVNKSMADHPIFQVPILIIAGLSHNSLRLCLDTVLGQSGLNVQRVLVAYDENYAECGGLAELYGFKGVAVNASASYMAQYAKAMAIAWQMFPQAQELIVIEEELLLTADFLHFMGEVLATLRKDKSLFAAVAWNDNGFMKCSGQASLVYRVGANSLLGYMLPREQYNLHMHKHMTQCCSQRAWELWPALNATVLVPDLARVSRRHVDGLAVLKPNVESMFHRQRPFVTTSGVSIQSVDRLQESAYDADIQRAVQTAHTKVSEALQQCVQRPAPGTHELLVPHAFVASTKSRKGRALALYYTDSNTLHNLCVCFGLYSLQGHTSRGIYKHMLRFSSNSHSVYLIGQLSIFGKHKASDVRWLSAMVTDNTTHL